MSVLNPKVKSMLDKLTRIKQDVVKSCGAGSGAGGLDLLQNPNLEMKRRMMDGIIMLLKDETALISQVTNVIEAPCKGEILRLDSCDNGVVAACNASCLPNYSIEDSYVTFDMVAYLARHSVTEEFLQCNEYGRERINDLAMAMLLVSMGNAMERAAILGDETLPTGPAQSADNNLLGANDGWIKLACMCTPECQVIDAAGAGPSKALFMAARKALPNRYKRDRSNYRFIVGPSIVDWWTEFLSGLPTDLGDDSIVNGGSQRIFGSSFFEVPLWAEDLPYTPGVGDPVDVTHILFTPLSNLYHFTRRNLEFQTEYKLECDRYETVGRMSADVNIADPAALVLIKNVDPCGTPWTGCQITCPGACGVSSANNPCE